MPNLDEIEQYVGTIRYSPYYAGHRYRRTCHAVRMTDVPADPVIIGHWLVEGNHWTVGVHEARPDTIVLPGHAREFVPLRYRWFGTTSGRSEEPDTYNDRGFIEQRLTGHEYWLWSDANWENPSLRDLPIEGGEVLDALLVQFLAWLASEDSAPERRRGPGRPKGFRGPDDYRRRNAIRARDMYDKGSPWKVISEACGGAPPATIKHWIRLLEHEELLSAKRGSR